jgi:hypothetical protein
VHVDAIKHSYTDAALAVLGAMPDTTALAKSAMQLPSTSAKQGDIVPRHWTLAQSWAAAAAAAAAMVVMTSPPPPPLSVAADKVLAGRIVVPAGARAVVKASLSASLPLSGVHVDVKHAYKVAPAAVLGATPVTTAVVKSDMQLLEESIRQAGISVGHWLPTQAKAVSTRALVAAALPALSSATMGVEHVGNAPLMTTFPSVEHNATQLFVFHPT